MPERHFTFDVENPNYGKSQVDSDTQSLQRKHAGAVVEVFQQGQDCTSLPVKKYEGCKDVWINSLGLNHGKSIYLKVGKYSVDMKSLIKYDLSKLPKNAKIEGAYLKMYSFNISNAKDMPVYRMLSSWGAGTGSDSIVLDNLVYEYEKVKFGTVPKEGECSWTYSEKPEKWEGVGVSKTGEDREGAALDRAREIPEKTKIAVKDEARGWVSWDVTKAAKEWVSDPENNFGVLLEKKLEGKDVYTQFLSSDHYDKPFRPKLIIFYKTDKK